MFSFVSMKILSNLLFFLFSVSFFSQQIDEKLVVLKSDLKSANSKLAKIKSHIALGDYLTEKEIYRAEQHFLDALETIGNTNSNKLNQLRARVYVGLGVVSRRKGDYTQAIDYYLQSKKIYEEQKDTTNIADVIHNIAMVHRYRKKYRTAIEGFKYSIKLNEKTKDTFSVAAGYNMLGVTYRYNKQLDSAFICYKKARQLFTLLKSEEDIIGVDSNLAVLYRKQKQFEKSFEIKNNAIKYYRKTGNKLSISIAYYNISTDYKAQKQYQKSLFYADSSLAIAKSGGFKENIMRAYLRKSFLNSKLNNFKDAYYNYRIFNRYSDTIYNIENAKKIQALELNYEFEKEKKELTYKADKEKSSRILYVILFLTTLITAVVILYFVQKNYKKNSKILDEKLEKEKIKKELLDQKNKVAEAEIKFLVSDNNMKMQSKKEFLEQLTNEESASSSDEVKTFLKSMISKLKQQVKTEEKFAVLQNKIDEVNKGFDFKLRDKYPTLNKNEREVCALLRLNLSIKEMASIRNTTVDSIKSMRYRIRKKINLKSGEELEKFIQNI